MRTEGSTEHPYRENPPEHLKEVHWAADLVKWPTEPWSYLRCNNTTGLSESFTGTASFWVRANGVLPGFDDSPDDVSIPLMWVLGPRIYETYPLPNPPLPPNVFNLPDYGFLLTIRRWNHGSEITAGTPGPGLECEMFSRRVNDAMFLTTIVMNNRGFYDPGQIPSDILDNKWAHFLLTWDLHGTANGAAAASGTIMVNKAAKPRYNVISFSRGLTTSPPPPFPYYQMPVPWDQPVLFFGGIARILDPEPPVVGPQDPMPPNHVVSFAHVWISTRQIITDVSKFVDDDGKPVKLGTGYEVTDEIRGAIKPDFYFAGGPSKFVTNTAVAGGTAELVGEPPITQTVAVQIGA